MNAEKLCTLVFLVPVLICFALGVIVAATTARRKREEEEVRAARAERVKAFRAAQKTVERAALQVKAAEAPKAPIGRIPNRRRKRPPRISPPLKTNARKPFSILRVSRMATMPLPVTGSPSPESCRT